MLCDMFDEDVIVMLVVLLGIGCWIVEIYLKFVLGCVDVFVVGDLVLVEVVWLFYDLFEWLGLVVLIVLV